MPSTEVISESPDDEKLLTLTRTNPDKQYEAVNILLKEEMAAMKKQSKLSPQRLRASGAVEYGLFFHSLKPGATGFNLVVRLLRRDNSSRCLKYGTPARLSRQHENSFDRKPRDPDKPWTDNILGIIGVVKKDFLEFIMASEDAKRIVKDKNNQIEIHGSLGVYQRMLAAVHKFNMAENEKGNREYGNLLMDLIRGRTNPKITKATLSPVPTLNRSQQNAVEYAVGSNLCLIRGPPGTGKTIVLYHTIVELLRRGENILICCGSHAAIDNLVERLIPISREFPIARLGHPHRVKPEVRRFSANTRRMTKKDFAKLKYTRIVAATLHVGYDLELFPECHTIVIDEVCQTLHPQCWVPLVENSSLRRLIVAGDDKQLPPTIKTHVQEAVETLNITLYDTLHKVYGKDIVHSLDTQYRMSENIMRFSSDYMYEGAVKPDAKVANQRLYHVPGVNSSAVTMPSVLWIDTSSLGDTEERGRLGMISNLAEAKLVKSHCLKLQSHGVKLSDIGVITPYSHQKLTITEILPFVEVNTVDGFQGRERNVIILSLVRSNEEGTIGFLADERRLNVAITRAKYQLCIVSDMKTLKASRSKAFHQWIEWCEKHATIVHPDSDGSLITY